MHAHVERKQQLAESCVSFGAVVLNKIAGDQHAVCAPITGVIVVKYPLQRLRSNSASQFAVRIGEQVWVGQVQDPNRITVSYVIARLNKAFPFDEVLVAVMLRFVWPGLLDADVIRLFGGKFGDLRTDAIQVQPRDLFIEVLRQYVNLFGVVVTVLP